MEIFRARTADGVWRQAHAAVMTAVRRAAQPSRAGSTLELLHVALEIDDPRQRWAISRRPAVNPAFAIADALWILAGSNDATVMNYWFPSLPKFSGDGPTYEGAYGHRLRQHFGVDQIKRACAALTANAESRQVVLQFWDVLADLPNADGVPRSQDVPCNVVSILKVREGRLEWTQVLRSNDLYRGLPNNLIQFTMLQEIMAGWLGLEVGQYHHWSDSLHIYTDSLGEFSCGEALFEEKNSDSLALPIEEGEALVGEMYRRMAKLTAPELSSADLVKVIWMPNASVAYQNLLRVLGAESARRHARWDQAQSVMADCTNPQLVQVWQAWSERVHSSTANRIASG